MSTTDKSTTSIATTTVPDRWEQIPCVQYGFPEEKGPTRTPKLYPIFEPVPDEATTASPVYLLTREQYERQQQLESGYEVAGEVTSIATELQNECEADDRVLYPVHIESDKLRDLGPDPLIEWFREFVEDYLNVPFHTCRRYYSGNRSIHVHVPRFVSGEDQRERLKELAETFCEETGAELDCGLYYAKRMFRLPGVEHEKTGMPKLEIDGVWDNAQLAQKVESASTTSPASYAEVIQDLFVSQESLTTGSPQTPLDDPLSLFRVLDSEKTILELESDTESIEPPLIEQDQCPDEDAKVPEWAQYNSKEFSPYALADGNDRSVAVLEVKGGAFARRDVRDGATLVPAYFYGARGCAGEFTKADEHAPLQLSDRDFEKWDYEAGDNVVIIGGQSRSSCIFRVRPRDATACGHTLTGSDASRQAALDYLEREGYEVGAAGTSGETTTSKTAERQGCASRVAPVRTSTTEAADLQQQAEQNDIETLTHKERWRVACRVLYWGWEPAWKWFKRQYGDRFEPDTTRYFFQNIIDNYPDTYRHVSVPDACE